MIHTPQNLIRLVAILACQYTDKIHHIQHAIVSHPHAGITPLHELGKRKEFSARHQFEPSVSHPTTHPVSQHFL
jgi:hypothetical protein